MIAFAKCVMATDYEGFKIAFAKINILLSSPTLSQSFIANLTNTDRSISEKIFHFEDAKSFDSDTDDFDPKSSLYMKLPFLNEIETTVKDVRFMAGNWDLTANKYQDSKFCTYLLQKMAPFSPLW